jgi:hypothetical protein
MPRNSSALGETDAWESNRKGRYMAFLGKRDERSFFSFWDILRALLF